MARPLRIEYPGAVHHVTSRGNRREAIVVDDADREIFVAVLTMVVERFGWRCHAWCLMGNHYHIVVETPQANLARGMRQLNGVFTQRINRRHGRNGHVFQGRYKAILVDRDAHLLEVCRYVVLNPVRARMAARAADWRWSSYAATAHLRTPPGPTCRDDLLALLSPTRSRAAALYRRFVEDGMGAASPWSDPRGADVLGDDAFRAKAAKRAAHHQAAAVQTTEVPRAKRRLQVRCAEMGSSRAPLPPSTWSSPDASS